MPKNFHCIPTYNVQGMPHYDYCRSPIACGSFQYCRKRNFDGYPMTDTEIARRKKESDEGKAVTPRGL